MTVLEQWKRHLPYQAGYEESIRTVMNKAERIQNSPLFSAMGSFDLLTGRFDAAQCSIGTEGNTMKLSLSIIKEDLNLPISRERIFYQELTLTGVQLYGEEIQPDILYIILPRQLDEIKIRRSVRSAVLINDHDCLEELSEIEYLRIPEYISEKECLFQLQRIFFQYNRWESRIHEELYGACRLQVIMDLGSRLLGNPIALFDLSMTVVCLGGEDQIDQEDVVWKGILENQTPPIEILSSLKDRNLYQRVITQKRPVVYELPATGGQCMRVNIFIDGKRIGSIDLQDSRTPFLVMC